jgi:hypothetical protein
MTAAAAHGRWRAFIILFRQVNTIEFCFCHFFIPIKIELSGFWLRQLSGIKNLSNNFAGSHRQAIVYENACDLGS